MWEQLFHQITGNSILGVPIENQPCKGGDLICERIIVGESLSSLYSLPPHPPCSASAATTLGATLEALSEKNMPHVVSLFAVLTNFWAQLS